MLYKCSTHAVYEEISKTENGYTSSGQAEKSAHHGLDNDSHLYQVFDLSHSADAHGSL